MSDVIHAPCTNHGRDILNAFGVLVARAVYLGDAAEIVALINKGAEARRAEAACAWVQGTCAKGCRGPAYCARKAEIDAAG